MFKQKQNVRRRELMRTELGESLEHARRAAGHAAGEVRASMGPKVAPAAERVRSTATDSWESTRAALAPLSESTHAEPKQARKRAKREREKVQAKGRAKKLQRERAGRRWPALAGLVAGGIALGAVAAAVLRRQQYQELEGFGPAGEPDTAEGELTGPTATGKPDGATS